MKQICTDIVADDTVFKPGDWILALYGKEDSAVAEEDHDKKTLELATVSGRIPEKNFFFFYVDECPLLAESLGVEATPSYMRYCSNGVPDLLVVGTLNEQQLYALVQTGVLP